MRKWLRHATPEWVEYPEFFITICCRPQGFNQLCLPKTGPRLLESFATYHKENRWFCSLVVLMPDHLHALIQIPERLKFSNVIRSWKSFSTKTMGIRWHHGFFDHRIRRSESLTEKWAYMEMNPVRAGLIQNPADWPYRWEPQKLNLGTDERPRSS